MSSSSFVTKTCEEDIGPRQVAFLHYKQTVSATTDNELKTATHLITTDSLHMFLDAVTVPSHRLKNNNPRPICQAVQWLTEGTSTINRAIAVELVERNIIK